GSERQNRHRMYEQRNAQRAASKSERENGRFAEQVAREPEGVQVNLLEDDSHGASPIGSDACPIDEQSRLAKARPVRENNALTREITGRGPRAKRDQRCLQLMDHNSSLILVHGQEMRATGTFDGLTGQVRLGAGVASGPENLIDEIAWMTMRQL